MRISKMEAYVDEVNKRPRRATSTMWTNFTFGHMGDGNLHFVVSCRQSGAEARETVERSVYEPLATSTGPFRRNMAWGSRRSLTSIVGRRSK